MAALLASYALEHFLLSTVLLLVAAAGLGTTPASSRHRWLLGGFLLAVVGPMLPFWFLASGDVPTGGTGPSPEAVGAGGLSLDPTWARPVLAVWAIGALIQLYRMARAWRGAARLIHLSPTAWEIEQEHADLLPRGVRVHLSPSFGPAVLGVLNPCIVLPATLPHQLSRDSLRAVLAHEVEHILRRDPAWHALQRAALALLWWNPALARLARWLDEARELACDAGAVRGREDRYRYAEALLEVAGQPRPDNVQLPFSGLAMASGTSLLEHRIDALIDAGEPPRRVGAAAGALLVLAMLTGWAAVAMSAPDVRMVPSQGASMPRADSPQARAVQAAPAPGDTSGERVAAQAEFERLAQAARIDFEQKSQAARMDFEQQSQAAQIAYEQRAQAAQIEFEQRMDLAQRRRGPAGETAR